MPVDMPDDWILREQYNMRYSKISDMLVSLFTLVFSVTVLNINKTHAK